MSSVQTELAAMLPNGDSIVTFVLIFAGFIVFVGIVFFVVYFLRFKHRLEIKTSVNSDKHGMPFVLRCRQYKDDAGIEYWKPFFKPGIGELPAPPMEFRELYSKQAWKAACYLVEGEPRWIKSTLADVMDPLTGAPVMEPITDKDGNQVTDKDGAVQYRTKKEAQLQVFSGTQRWAYQNSIKRAMKKAESWKQMVLPAIGMGMCLICLILMVIFYDDATDKPIEMQNLANAALDSMEEITKQQAITTERLNILLEELGRLPQPLPEGHPSEPPG